MARILIVDDERAIVAFLRAVFTRAGHDVQTALKSEEARALISEETDLLVTDIHMPGGNGIDFAQALEPRFPRLRVLFITGFAPTDKRLEHRRVLLKPFKTDVLLATVEELLAT